MRVSPSRLWARVADRLGTDPESAQLEVLGAAGYSWDDATGELTSWPDDPGPNPARRRPGEPTERA